jgi:hypothetical protein
VIEKNVVQMILQELQSINHGSSFMVYWGDVRMSEIDCPQLFENIGFFFLVIGAGKK